MTYEPYTIKNILEELNKKNLENSTKTEKKLK